MPRKASIPANWSVPEVFRRRLGDVAGRQRAMAADGHLLLILHELPSEESAERHLRLFWRDAEHGLQYAIARQAEQQVARCLSTANILVPWDDSTCATIEFCVVVEQIARRGPRETG